MPLNFTPEESHEMITDILTNIVEDHEKSQEIAYLLEITPSQLHRFIEKLEIKTSEVTL